MSLISDKIRLDWFLVPKCLGLFCGLFTFHDCKKTKWITIVSPQEHNLYFLLFCHAWYCHSVFAIYLLEGFITLTHLYKLKQTMGPQTSVTVSKDYIVLLLWDPVQMARTLSKASPIVIFVWWGHTPLSLTANPLPGEGQLVPTDPLSQLRPWPYRANIAGT